MLKVAFRSTEGKSRQCAGKHSLTYLLCSLTLSCTIGYEVEQNNRNEQTYLSSEDQSAHENRKEKYVNNI